MAGRSSSMAREKIKIRKIGNIAARQVTFSKRRRGIFKKAEELAVLCDADVALIIFSATGKLFDYSSNRMNDIFTRYNMHSKTGKREEEPFLELQLENSNVARLSKEAADQNQELRKLKGENLEGMDLEGLQELESILEGSLSRVIDTKEKRITNKIEALQKKGDELMDENIKLKQRLFMSSREVKAASDVDQYDINTTTEEGRSSYSVTNGPPLTEDESSETSLKLGLWLFQ